MATITDPSGTQRGKVLHDAWNVFTGRSSTFLRRGFDFFSAYPPLAQGLYYLLIGLWLFLGGSSYQKLTGHQGDTWLIEGIGVLMVVIGGTLCLAAYRRQGSPEVLFIAFGTALGQTIVDLHLVYRGFSRWYLVDVIIQVGLVTFWVYGWIRSNQGTTIGAPQVPVAQVASPPTSPTAMRS